MCQATLHRRDLTDEQREEIQPHPPPQKPTTGRPTLDHRCVPDGILLVLRTGSPWRDLPPCYGNWSTIATRFYCWAKTRVFAHLLQRLQEIARAAGEIDWEEHQLDSSVIRAHPNAAGAKGGMTVRRWDAPEAGSAPKSTWSATVAADRSRSTSREESAARCWPCRPYWTPTR